MDEADLLADRCGIIANGRMQCVGSTMFLKEHYGVGYVLSVVKSLAPASGASTDSSPSLVTGFATDVTSLVGIVQRHVPTASVSSDVGQELQIRLPLGAVSAFPLLFEELEVRVLCTRLVIVKTYYSI